MIASDARPFPEEAKAASEETDHASVDCAHCGLPAPPSRVGPAFCCDGCRGAYALIHEWDLADYYAIREQLGGRASRPTADDEAFALLDEPQVLGEALQDVGDNCASVRLAVDGVHCGACAWLIERSVPLIGGWKAARVHVPRREVEIVFSRAETSLSSIAKTLATFGYRLRPIADAADAARVDPERMARLKRIAVAGFCFANAMWIAIALYAGRSDAGGDESIAASHAGYFTFFGTVLAGVSVFGPGRVFLRSAWAAVRTRTPHIDLPVSLGLLAGFAGSVVSLVSGVGETYFDSLCGLVFFLLLGRELQARGQQRASAAVKALASLRPPVATRLEPDGRTMLVRVADIAAGDELEVGAGELVPVDGVVESGESHVDQSILTGESAAVFVAAGDAVAAGVRNIERRLRIRAVAVEDDTRVAAISRLVEDSLSNRTPLVERADRIGGTFVCVVLAVAAAAFAFAATQGSVLDAGQRAVALLVVACPCALALATPLAIGVAVGRCAKRGILIRRGDVFERLESPGTIWFDKTGTLTEGQPSLSSWNGDDETLRLAASLERDSLHPVASCLVNAATRRGLTLSQAADAVHHRLGVEGVVDGRRVVVGSRSLLDELRLAVPAIHLVQADAFADAGTTPNFVAVDGQVCVVFGVTDRLRNDALKTVESFRDAGWSVGVLSGDHRDVVAAIGAQLTIGRGHVFGELSPEEKLTKIHSSLGEGGPVVFVGDGVNDAAALAAADVGIATSGAAEASLQAAAVYCPGALSDICELLVASSATVRGIRRLLGVSLGYNVAAGAAAICGLVSPLVAAVLMPLSSLAVTGLAFAVPTFGGSGSGKSTRVLAERMKRP